MSAVASEQSRGRIPRSSPSGGTPAPSAARCAGRRRGRRTSWRCPAAGPSCSTPGSVVPGTGGSRPTNSTSSKTPVPSRSSGRRSLVSPSGWRRASTTSTTSASAESRSSPTPCRRPPTAAPAVPKRRWPSSGWSIVSPPRSASTRPRFAGATTWHRSTSRTPPGSARCTTSATTPPRCAGRWRPPATTSCAPSRPAGEPPPIRWPSASAWPRTSR